MKRQKLPIDKGIKIPARMGPPVKYPFSEMEPGDSFFIADVPKDFSIYSVVRQFNGHKKKELW